MYTEYKKPFSIVRLVIFSILLQDSRQMWLNSLYSHGLSSVLVFVLQLWGWLFSATVSVFAIANLLIALCYVFMMVSHLGAN